MNDIGTDSDFIDLSFMKSESEGKTGYLMSMGFFTVDADGSPDFDGMVFMTADAMYDSIESGILAISSMCRCGIISLDKFVGDYHVYNLNGDLIESECGNVEKMLSLMKSHMEYDFGVPN